MNHFPDSLSFSQSVSLLPSISINRKQFFLTKQIYFCFVYDFKVYEIKKFQLFICIKEINSNKSLRSRIFIALNYLSLQVALILTFNILSFQIAFVLILFWDIVVLLRCFASFTAQVHWFSAKQGKMRVLSIVKWGYFCNSEQPK